MRLRTIRTFIFSIVVIGAVTGAIYWLMLPLPVVPKYLPQRQMLFPVESVDTMKDSRDRAREVLTDPASFAALITTQMQEAKRMGATHVAIDTPYDPEFLPVLTQWVRGARQNGLSVWFRGNLSGWEGWFDYATTTPLQHTDEVVQFITNNPSLFKDGDIFTACPECENGALGDPRATGQVIAYRQFLTDEQSEVAGAFSQINKKVVTSYDPMNLDVAKLVMDPATTRAFGNTITIDHYAPSAGKFQSDVEALHDKTGAQIVLGEFGAPIPDLNGSLSPAEQATYVRAQMQGLLEESAYVPAVNYWTLKHGSTALLNDDSSERPAYAEMRDYYTASYVGGFVLDALSNRLPNIPITVTDGTFSYQVETAADGSYQIFLPHPGIQIAFGSSTSYVPQSVRLARPNEPILENITLALARPSLIYSVKKNLYEVRKMIQVELKAYPHLYL